MRTSRQDVDCLRAYLARQPLTTAERDAALRWVELGGAIAWCLLFVGWRLGRRSKAVQQSPD